MDHASALVDPTVLQALHEYQVQDEPDPAAEVAQAFLDVMPDRLAQLRAAARDGNVAEAQRIAHQVRGSCAAVGAIAMHGVATEIEATATSSSLPSLMERLEALFDSTRLVLKSFVEQ